MARCPQFTFLFLLLMMRPTQITLRHLLSLILTLVVTMVLGLSGLKHYGAWVGVAGAVVGLLLSIPLSYLLIWSPVAFIQWCMVRGIARRSSAELRQSIAEGEWRFFNHTVALVTLASRREDVSVELPRIAKMLASDDVITRLHAWDALRMVFEEEAKRIGDYKPSEPAGVCRQKVSRFCAEAIRS